MLLLRTAPAQGAAGTQTIHVAAAADMEPVFAVFGPIFEKRSGAHLSISYGSSAMLAQQLRQGSPADIFFSADFYFPEQLVADKLTESRNPTPYAKGSLVLYARHGAAIEPVSVDLLSRKDVRSVAIANPDKAPYGRAAMAALRQMKLYDNVAPHLVQAESVAQAGEFALSGNAQFALISETLAVSPKYKAEGSYGLFPSSQYPTIEQCAVILKAGKNPAGARTLLQFMLSDEVQLNLPKVGLQQAK